MTRCPPSDPALSLVASVHDRRMPCLPFHQTWISRSLYGQRMASDWHREKGLLVRMPEDMKDALRRRAEDEGRPMTEIVLRLIREYLDEYGE